ncbi:MULTISPECIES: type II toxin-antitoxin system VapC family toxin [unclassified Thiocapsa]|uniref:type II toxin-antitoxin system VapC family toxin n=1 Tax=unclassified Thiocapsa TaxID=2641286 RepID=UPI0035AFA783
MQTVFADTCYWIALLNPRDQLHDRTVRVSQSLRSVRIVTTDEVLTEFLNYFGDRGVLLRQTATRMVAQIQVDKKIHIEPQSRETFDAGFRFFRARLDKGYSLTDCISMDLMQHMQLTEVLTNDGHFSQEGFSCLLREDVQWEN